MGDEGVWEATDGMQAQKTAGISKANLQNFEKACGINYNPSGVLADGDLRKIFKPCSAATRDSMHVLYSNGVVNVEVFLLRRALSQNVPAFSWRTLWEFADADWHWASAGPSRDVYQELLHQWEAKGVCQR